MKRNNIISVLLVLGLSCSCSFLEPYPTEILDADYVTSNQTTMKGLVNKCYDFIPTNYDDNESAYLDCLTDNAAETSTTSVMSRFAVGVTHPNQDLFSTYWTRDYKAIYNLNLFIKDRKGLSVRYMTDQHLDELFKNKTWGEAHALRAWFYWDLLKKFGGRATTGELLGVPLVLEPVRIWDYDADEIKNVEFPRATYDECVEQILKDCDTAIAYLPAAHRDFLVENTEDLRVMGSRNYGRMDGMTATAIKALVCLTWASPRFNPKGDVTRWEKAAKFAKEVIDFKINVDGNVSGGFTLKGAVDWTDPNSPSIIFAGHYNTDNEAMERMFYPNGFQGNGTMGATQDFVDCFGMADGYPLGKSPTYTYDPQNPYVNRDPRFYSIIFYNGRKITTGYTDKRDYTFENWENGGKDAAEISSRNSRTNYHIKKFVYSGVDWRESTTTRAPRCKFHIRWAHMVLAFAEAANRVGGPNAKIDGLSAKEAISYLRSRNTYDGDKGFTEDPYLDEISLAGTEAFDKFLRNERRIETCFEGSWFYDIRRWSTTLGDLNKEVHRPTITRNGEDDYTYGTEVFESRVFRSAYMPIPYTEMLKTKGLVQNEGWESWQ